MKLLLLLSFVADQGQAARAAARELMKALESRFAREIAEEGVERLETRIASCLEKYGDDVAGALKRVGPRVGLDAVERFGAGAAKFIGEYGDEGARLLAIEGAAAPRVAAKYGAEGVELMAKHRGIAAPLIEQFGDDGVRALKNLSPDGAVTLKRLEESIRASGKGREILGVIERFGNRACDFLWRNKGVIFGAAVLAAFLADPEPYLNGAKELVGATVAPVAREAAKNADWTVIILGGVITVILIVALKVMMRPRRA